MDFVAEILVPVVLVLAILVGGAFLVIGGPILLFGDRRVPEIKLNAERIFKDNGFQVVGYQGYSYGLISTPGGCVWYTLKKGEITYKACLSRWGDEYHIYNLKAIDAIKP